MPKGRSYAPDGVKDGNWFEHLGLPKCYSAPPNRELMTSTGIMLNAPYKPDNSYVPFPPPRSYLLRDSRNFKLANDFSEHNNRHLLQSTGEYFGDEMKCPMSSDQSKDNKPNSGADNMNEEVDFSEFVWMGEENLEEFDRNVELELWEEQFIESCFNEMWRSEDQETVYFNESRSSAVPPPVENGSAPGAYNYPAGFGRPQQPNHLYQRQTGPADEGEAGDISAMMDHLSVADRNGINQARSSKLNPDAAVFIPRACNMTVTSTPTNVDR